MKLTDLFVIRTASRETKAVGVTAGTVGEPSGTTSGVAAFITPQSLVSFPVASLVVSALTGLGKALSLAEQASALSAAALIGSIVFLIGVSDRQARPDSLAKWTVAGGIAIVNTLMLAASALGVLNALHK